MKQRDVGVHILHLHVFHLKKECLNVPLRTKWGNTEMSWEVLQIEVSSQCMLAKNHRLGKNSQVLSTPTQGAPSDGLGISIFEGQLNPSHPEAIIHTCVSQQLYIHHR